MVARFKDRADAHGFRQYVADSLQLLPQGKYLSLAWGAKPSAYDGMTAEQIADSVIAGLESE